MNLRPECCPTCAADPHTAPGRYCAPARCLCGHEACPATGYVNPRAVQLAAVPDPLPVPELGTRGWALQERMLSNVGRTPPPALTHTDHLRTEWDEREPDTWIDRT